MSIGSTAKVSWSRRETTTLAVCCTALFMVSLDNTVLNVALPSMQRSLHASTADLQWAVDCYLLVRASSLFICGSLGDRFGRRRLFNLGQYGFILGSVACALAPSLQWLIVFRSFQAVGSAFMTPSSLAIIANTFKTRTSRAKAIGFWSATTGISTAAGPLVGGILVETFGWRSVFWINIPVGLLAIAGTRILEESRAEKPRPFDVPGQATIGLGLFSIVYVLIAAPNDGWGSPLIELFIGIALICVVAFPMLEHRSKHPLLEPADFKRPPLVGAVVLAVVAFVTAGGFLFFNTLYLQEVRGFVPFHAGLAVLPLTVMPFFLAPFAGRLIGTRGPRLPATIAVVLMGAAMALAAVVVAPSTPLVLLLLVYLLLGCASGLVNPPITNAAVSGMPMERAGVASATTSTARQVGTTLGVALIGSIVFSIAHVGNKLTAAPGHGVTRAVAVSFAHGLRYGYGAIALLSILSLVTVTWAFKFRPELVRENYANEVLDEPRGSSNNR